MLGVICSKLGICLVAQPRPAASLSWIAAIDQKEDGGEHVSAQQVAATGKNSGQRSDDKSVAASPTPVSEGQAELIAVQIALEADITS